MPREPRGLAAPVATIMPTNSMVASAARYQGKVERIYRPLQNWQRECYRHYGICGEARFAAQFMGHALSRAVLNVAKRSRDGKIEKQVTGTASDYLAQLAFGSVGQGQMLQSIGVHLTIAGECFLVGRKINGADTWEVVSPLEMVVNGTQTTWAVDYGDGKAPVDLSEKDVVIRIWLPDPAKRIEADSPFKSLLPVLDEIEWSTRHIFSQLSSRLAGAGMMLFPTEATFGAPPTQDGSTKAQSTTSEVNGIMRMLADTMMASLGDPAHPAARVPIIGKMPGEHIDKVKLIEFWSKVDEKAMAIRRDALSRFADGMDMPREQIAGMSGSRGTGGGKSNGVSHWGAWQIEESTIKLFVEPMLDIVVAALTLYYLAPLMDSDPVWVVVYDTTALKLRPDRSQEAITMNAAGLVADRVAREETGFGEEAAMDDTEFRVWVLRKIAGGSATPEMVNAALTLLGAPLGITVAPTAVPNESRPAPTQDNLPKRPRTPLDNAALLPVAEALALRALERAGNRIKGELNIKLPNLPAYAVHTMHHANGSAERYLADAWSTAPMVLEGLGDVKKIVASLDAYCRSVVAAQEPHSRERLARFLEVGCSPA